ncbi:MULTISPECIES: ABC transporter permease [Bosea]|uniref:ABC transporter permease n=1 Tax=Bosea TaxID=85413 RepID=UPI00214FA0B7|nr:MULTISPECIES: ABC transporter permease [Bosea]MCR4523531.1 ABC transporter permease [Bosea sp. 47.2.35]MDR6830431.1 peptide/nickel transport system permease protein [Bosea robiniae]MDR6897186.1 peptide/nickel transport system permease protein [Bosea sp. BE109]MDR7140626.1 peptide/nickel transport system permease protein [Bosea sp. BE168]MDR7177323.1 peptide/nickel transport system permease protein [Bosea sp. BE271]
MPGFLLRRLGQALVTILGVVTLIFFVQRLTGDPTYLLVPETATQADIAALRHQLGFDRPLVVQYLDFLGELARFDLGQSVVQRVPVTTIIASRLPYTLMLAAGALTVACGIGVPIGILLAIFRNSPAAKAAAGFVLAAQSMPTFWSGILMILVFSVLLGWLPPSSTGDLSHLVMPSFALGLLSMATFARITRSALLDELSKDYVRTARSRGVRSGRLLIRHLARNASIPVITVAALEISNLLAGAVIVETVFAWPGLGQVTVQAILARDFMIVQGVVLLGAFVTVLLNLLSDLLYSLVDPRIVLEGGR